MRVRAFTHIAVAALGLSAPRAHGDVLDGIPLRVTSSTGFVPVTGMQPTNALGFLGDWTRDGTDGSITVPFAGWADFGLPGDRLTVEWDFTAEAPDRFLGWRLQSRSESDRILAGLEWNGIAWTAIGPAMIEAAESGRVQIRLDSADANRVLRIAFHGLSVGPDGSTTGGVFFAIPAPGTVALLALAATAVRRRR
jgi:hypothetical protein